MEGKIVDIIKSNATVTIKVLARELGIGIDTVKEYIENLKTKGIVQRVGNKRTGYWQINRLN
ncbi:hypothetical protein FACS1894199_09020 [Bacteroidia bacterium]|nr:hypothetical protein FACS1894199_09020 [Bacteroidia bacterium]